CRDVWSLYSVFSLFFIILFPLTHPPPYSTLFPYTTLFRSDQRVWPDRPGFSPATSRRQRHQLCRSGGRLPVLRQRRALSDRFEPTAAQGQAGPSADRAFRARTSPATFAAATSAALESGARPATQRGGTGRRRAGQRRSASTTATGRCRAGRASGTEQK